VGTYRIQVKGKDLVGIQPLPFHDIAIHLKKAEEMNEPLPISICLGNDPILNFMSSTPIEYVQSEYDFAGTLKGEPIELTKNEVGNLDIPARSEIVLEGYIIPSINNDIKLKNCVSELVNNIKDTKILNKKLQNKHNELMTELIDLTELLDNTIECKKEILNSNDKNLTKGQRLLKEDDKKIKAANKKIEKINNIYKEINNFGVNTKSPIL
ncbi:UbiD family decarboxylase, partial [Clostridium sp.]|uniref:UbiD family decarboxylase n=1 Tax=Clostridium sp. TaxID=1506 RepID=UPI0025BC6846